MSPSELTFSGMMRTRPWWPKRRARKHVELMLDTDGICLFSCFICAGHQMTTVVPHYNLSL